MTLCQNSAPGSSFQNYSAPSGLVKIVRSVQGVRPLLFIPPLRGLKHRTSSEIRQQADKFWNPPVGGQVLESCLNFFILSPLSFILAFILVLSSPCFKT